MFPVIKEVLTKITNADFEAYIVGGYVRDYLMNMNSIDVDICTNAKPKDIFDIFKEYAVLGDEYGCVTIKYKKITFQITTYRKDIKYNEHRKPVKIAYVDSLSKDIERRDITINSLCMDSEGNIIDLLGGKADVDNKIIKVIGNPFQKLKEDPLRIMRVIRFATRLNFTLDKNTEKAIYKSAKFVKKLSYERKMEELIKILTSSNIKYGIELLVKYKLDKYLEISGIKDIKITNDIIGILSQLNIENIYPMSKNQKYQIKAIKMIKNTDILDNYNLYKNGPYLSGVAALISGLNHSEVNLKYDNLPIKTPSDINIKSEEICLLLNKKPDAWLKDIIVTLEKAIIYGELNNNYEEIKKFLLNMEG